MNDINVIPMRKTEIIIMWHEAELTVSLIINEGEKGNYEYPGEAPSAEIRSVFWNGVNITDLCYQTGQIEDIENEVSKFMEVEYE